MDYKIEKHFQHSQFYRNYNDINIIVSYFKKIRNEYDKSKIKCKKILDNARPTFSMKFWRTDLKNRNSIYNINLSVSIKGNIILSNKINIGHNIKKYVKYSDDINDDFIKSVKIGTIKNINTLIKNGARLFIRNNYALNYSSRYGNIDVVKFLIEKGSNIHFGEDQALVLSSEYGHIEVVKFLLEKGSNIHAHNDSALKLSSANGHIEVVKFLVKKGANIHADGDFAIMMSRHNGHIDVTNFLLNVHL
jgi:ankyrin repeat protein